MNIKRQKDKKTLYSFLTPSPHTFVTTHTKKLWYRVMAEPSVSGLEALPCFLQATNT